LMVNHSSDKILDLSDNETPSSISAKLPHSSSKYKEI
jgi:hypothetical protein